MKNNNPFYPDLIVGLPEADIPFDGVRGWLLQGRLLLYTGRHPAFCAV